MRPCICYRQNEQHRRRMKVGLQYETGRFVREGRAIWVLAKGNEQPNRWSTAEAARGEVAGRPLLAVLNRTVLTLTPPDLEQAKEQASLFDSKLEQALRHSILRNSHLLQKLQGQGPVGQKHPEFQSFVRRLKADSNIGDQRWSKQSKCILAYVHCVVFPPRLLPLPDKVSQTSNSADGCPDQPTSRKESTVRVCECV